MDVMDTLSMPADPEQVRTMQAPQGRRFTWRRLVQFRLLTLLLVVTLAASVLGWWHNTARRQQAAVAELQIQGVRVWYDFQVDPSSHAPRPKWLLNALGVDCFANVDMVEVSAKSSSVDLEALERLPEI